MKIERVSIADLMSVLLAYLKEGATYIDIKLIEGENTLRIRPSDSSDVKELPSPPPKDTTDDIDNLIKPI